jgi:hypothetical protein
VRMLAALGCASPQQKAWNRVVRDYRLASAESAAYAREHVNRLAAAAQTFQLHRGHWPHTLDDLARFAYENDVPCSPGAFNAVTFAALADGGLQIHYDVDCSHFHTDKHRFTQTGALNVKPR